MVKKESENTKEVSLSKTFTYDDTNNNIINHIFKYYKLNCQSEFSVLVNDQNLGGYIAKELYKYLFSITNKEYQPKLQIIDERFKCKYIITYGGYIIPTVPSGSIYNLNISTNIENYIKDYTTTYKYLNEIYKLTNNKINLKPIGVFYNKKNEKKYIVTAIMTNTYDSIPIINNNMSIDYIKKEKLLVQYKPDEDMIDMDISKGPKNFVIDDRIYEVSKNNYETEMYQLFRLHLSYYLNNVPYGLKNKEKLETLLNNKIDKNKKLLEIKKLLYHISNNELYKTFTNLLEQFEGQKGSSKNELYSENNIGYHNINEVTIIPQNDISKHDSDDTQNSQVEFTEQSEPSVPVNIKYQFMENGTPPVQENVNFASNEKHWINIFPENKEINYPSFNVMNNRELCYNNSNKDSCNYYQHCNWINSKNMCMLNVRKDLFVNFVNKVAEEFIQNELKADEILRRGNYFVSDIVNYNIYTERPGERIIMTSNTNMNKILSEVFGKESIPQIGKRRNKIISIQNYDQLNEQNPLRDINNWYLQTIIENNNTIFRAFVNGYYWLTHPYNDIIYRNLGYYSSLQTNLSNIYKSQVIDWLLSPENKDEIDNLLPYIKYGKILEFVIKLSVDVVTLTNCIIELYIMSKIYNTIIYVNNDNYNIIYVFHPKEGLIYDYKKNKEQFNQNDYINNKNYINIRFHYISKNIYPDKVEVMYPKN